MSKKYILISTNNDEMYKLGVYDSLEAAGKFLKDCMVQDLREHERDCKALKQFKPIEYSGLELNGSYFKVAADLSWGKVFSEFGNDTVYEVFDIKF